MKFSSVDGLTVNVKKEVTYTFVFNSNHNT